MASGTDDGPILDRHQGNSGGRPCLRFFVQICTCCWLTAITDQGQLNWFRQIFHCCPIGKEIKTQNIGLHATLTAVQQVEKCAGGRQQPHDGHARSSQAFQDGRRHFYTDVAIAKGHRASILRDGDGHPNHHGAVLLNVHPLGQHTSGGVGVQSIQQTQKAEFGSLQVSKSILKCLIKG